MIPMASESYFLDFQKCLKSKVFGYSGLISSIGVSAFKLVFVCATNLETVGVFITGAVCSMVLDGVCPKSQNLLILRDSAS